jgi:geranylgeranyl diphosphate synthase, type II
MDVKEVLKTLADEVDRAIVTLCDRHLAGPSSLVEAMRYSLEAGGKRVRPVLVLLCSELYGGPRDIAMIPAVAIEMVHTFSLIHDDLPAMDNDDFRRGRPTSHRVYGEAMAILAGDGLLAFAFELIGRHYMGPAERAIRLIGELAEATGPAGMTGGQALDMAFGTEGRELADVEAIHRLKTAALIRCACRMGAISAGATDLEAISEFGLKLGLAFQVMDDYLDQTSTQAALGKRASKDAAGKKPNYAVVSGDLEGTRRRAVQLATEAKAALGPFGLRAESLKGLADKVVENR